MSHPAQKKFCKSVRKKLPQFFRDVDVIDVGSLDINGNNRYLFSRSSYDGIDIVPGKNVNWVGNAHELLPRITNKPAWDVAAGRIVYCGPQRRFDVVISTECLEHDKHYKETLTEMFDALRIGGLLLVTCAGEGREEHGTTENHPWCSPGTNDYYQNITNEMFASILPAIRFEVYHLEQRDTDLNFYGIKKK